jgi:hypothetical protein
VLSISEAEFAVWQGLGMSEPSHTAVGFNGTQYREPLPIMPHP